MISQDGTVPWLYALKPSFYILKIFVVVWDKDQIGGVFFFHKAELDKK